MEVVIQEETTGCGIAASAALAGLTYAEAKEKTGSLGIHASDTSLWSETEHVRTLLRSCGVSVSPEETPFESWEKLPDKALLAIKWHMERASLSGTGLCLSEKMARPGFWTPKRH